MFSSFRKRAAVPGVLLAFWALGTGSVFGQGDAENLSASFRKAAKRILPAVVSVRARVPGAGPLPVRPGLGLAEMLPRAFEPDFFPVETGGSGVVIDAAKGHVLTSDHLVQSASPVVVVLRDGRERAASQVRRDPKSGLALLVLDNAAGLTQAEWGDSDALETGDWVLAVGLPESVSAGIVSGKGRGIGAAPSDDLIQTDATINPGNSGGPLVNLKGQVVGINSAIRARSGAFEGFGFAVPAARARRIASELAERGKVRRAYLGAQIGPVDGAAAERLGPAGAVTIIGVSTGSPAGAAGIKPGDVIVALNGKPVGGTAALHGAIEVARVGEPLTLTVSRDGKRLDVKVVPTEQPETFGFPDERLGPGRLVRRVPRGLPPIEPGANVPLHPELFPELGLLLSEPVAARAPGAVLRDGTGGLMVNGVSADSPAGRAGLEIGMRITEAAGRKVNTIEEFRAALVKVTPAGELPVRVLNGPKAEYRLTLDEPPPPPKPKPSRE